jgi:ubiquinone biosynthesis protein COQ9
MSASSSFLRATPRAPGSLRAAAAPSRILAPSVASRCFHSHSHPQAASTGGDAERAILAAAYKHVPAHGFTTRALGLGARDAGYLDISASILPDGAFSLILHHLATTRETLAGRCSHVFEEDGQRGSAGVGAKVASLTWDRLMANRDVIHQWQEALAIMAQPSHAPASLKELAMLSDEIWFLAGDKAVDPSWYTKRATLSMIYSSSELFMTNDKSPDFIETRRFLDRRLNEVSTFGGVIGSLGQWTSFTLNAGLNVLRSKGARI